jgi:hypothetical protein
LYELSAQSILLNPGVTVLMTVDGRGTVDRKRERKRALWRIAG